MCQSDFEWSCRIAVEAVLDILWGRTALVVEEDGELQQRRGKLDEADAMVLRCLMRRYGWERRDPEVPTSANLLVDGMFQGFHLQQEQMRRVRLVFGSGITAHEEFSGFGRTAQPSQSNGGARLA